MKNAIQIGEKVMVRGVQWLFETIERWLITG